jgi:hypothetical protein
MNQKEETMNTRRTKQTTRAIKTQTNIRKKGECVHAGIPIIVIDK